jgi:hypothetical protein
MHTSAGRGSAIVTLRVPAELGARTAQLAGDVTGVVTGDDVR